MIVGPLLSDTVLVGTLTAWFVKLRVFEVRHGL